MLKSKSDAFFVLLGKKRICFECCEPILPEDKIAVILTLNNEPRHKDEAVTFHFSCWVDHYKKAVNLGIEQRFKMANAMVGNMLKNLKEKNGKGKDKM